MYVEVAEVNQVPPSEKELIFVCWGGGLDMPIFTIMVYLPLDWGDTSV